MKVFSIFGVSNSGKTTTTEAIITELCRRNYTVGSIKDIHFEDFIMDTEGTDTWRHKRAGSSLVTARGLYETGVMFPFRLPLEKLLLLYDQDFVVLEGANNFLGPAIISAHTEEEINERMRDTVFAVTGRISETISEYQGLPVFDARKDVIKMVDLIIEAVPEWTGQKEWLEQVI
ncbi:MAG: molybdopterin-guanine dinucleotide biosynthesis protein B [Anaerovoracaceae bacterium]|jgi:molybdopterin-guanine dinucleotide biosynthesis protein B